MKLYAHIKSALNPRKISRGRHHSTNNAQCKSFFLKEFNRNLTSFWVSLEGDSSQENNHEDHEDDEEEKNLRALRVLRGYFPEGDKRK